MKDLFCIRLKEAMNLKGIKAIDLANKLEVNRAIISQYLSGRYKPNHDRIFEISSILNVNPVWLMGFDVPIDADIEIYNNELEFNNDIVNVCLSKITNMLENVDKNKKIEILDQLSWCIDKLVKEMKYGDDNK